MQTTTTIKRLIAAVLTVAIALTAIPFVVAADEPAADSVVFGTYNGAPIEWDVLETKANGDLVLITKDIAVKSKYYDVAKVPNYADSKINTFLNDTFYAEAFSAAEKALIKDSTVEYKYNNGTSTTATTGTVTAKVIIPSEAMFTAYGLGAASERYWLADGQGTKTGKAAKIVLTTGKTGNLSATTEIGVRPMITISAPTTGKFEAAEGVTFTIGDAAVTSYTSVADVAFKVVVDTEFYSAENLVVTLGETVLTAVDGVYTIPATSTDTVKVSGIVVLPADLTAYNDAVAQAAEVDSDLCYTEDLEAALAVDVSAYTKLDQAKVDEATAAILAAIANLKYKPADFTEYNKALALAREAFADKDGKYYSIKEAEPESQTSYELLLWDLLDKYEDKTKTPISSLTIDKQAEVDEATKVLNDFVASIPLKRADTSKWSDALRAVRNLSPNRYSNAAELIAEAEALVAEKDYVALNLDLTYQAEIDEATAALKAIAAKAEVIPVDFSALDAALEIANTYLAENFYTEEEMEGAGAAWDAFVAQREAINALDRSIYASYADDQKAVNDLTLALIRTMETIDSYERLTSMEEDFVNPVKEFFTEIADLFGLVNGLFTTLAGLLPLVIIGELVLYDVFALIGDEDLLAFVEKIGIKPAPEEPAPEEPAE